jgi:hypothetical protein
MFDYLFYQEDISDSDAYVVKIHMDELLLLSSLLKIPIYMPKDLFSEACTDANLARSKTSNDREENLKASSAGLPITITAYRKVVDVPSSKSVDTEAPLAWNIYNPNTFFKMTNIQKRACLR